MEGSLQSRLRRIARASFDGSHRIDHLGDAVVHRAWEFLVQQEEFRDMSWCDGGVVLTPKHLIPTNGAQ